MENCKNCKHLFSKVDLLSDGLVVYCDVACDIIDFPLFMGGSKKCECYERREKAKFKYPKKERTK